MKILVFDNQKTYDLYQQGAVPSHWLYGVAELERGGVETVNLEYGSPSLRNQLKDLRACRKHRPDAIFFPFVNIRRHPLLFALAALRIIRIPIYGVVHRTPHSGLLSRFLLRGITRAFFLSPRNREEAIRSRTLSEKKTEDAHWGPDLKYYDQRISGSGMKEGYYIATGKENRDYALLVDVFKGRKERLIIHTCHSHAGNNYDYLEKATAPYDNMYAIIGDNSGANFSDMLKEMAQSKALLCPLLPTKINYCVGLSTIADAMALSLPVVLTRNPYHPIDVNANRIGFAVERAEEWSSALDRLLLDDLAEAMGRRARQLAEERYNIELFAQQLLQSIKRHVK